MKRPNPEKKLVCNDCLFCGGSVPICKADPMKRQISRIELYSCPWWCPFRIH